MSLSADDLRGTFRDLRLWRRGDQLAPHKPLLLLMTLADLQRGAPRLRPFPDVRRPLTDLLNVYGASRGGQKPENPFWRLRKDAAGRLWEVAGATGVRSDKSDNPRVGDLEHTSAGFSTEVHVLLSEDPALRQEIAALLLEAHFPPSWHDSILDAVGFAWEPVPLLRTQLAPRSPEFRRAVFSNYEYRCAICGYDGRLADTGVGLEAAHVQWITHEGPDTEDNGLCLCVLHPRLFDQGALGLDEERRLLVSREFHGGKQVQSLVQLFAGRQLLPQAGTPPVAVKHIRWHLRWRFRGRARTVA